MFECLQKKYKEKPSSPEEKKAIRMAPKKEKESKLFYFFKNRNTHQSFENEELFLCLVKKLYIFCNNKLNSAESCNISSEAAHFIYFVI